MKKLVRKLAIAVVFCLPCYAFAIALAPGVNTDDNNFLGPILQGQWNFSFGDVVSSELVEAGPRDLRLNGTAGIAFGANQQHRLKLTGDFLNQNIAYEFFSGMVRQWVSQGAAGFAYEYAIPNSWFQHVDLSTYYSYAPSFDLDPVISHFTQNGVTTDYIDLRRIAGSNAGGGEAGFSVTPWHGAMVGIAADYDVVYYKNRYHSQETAQGAGGTLNFTQAISKSFQLDLSGAVLAPYDEYQAGLSWLRPTRLGNFKVGVFGNYIQGKVMLPDSSMVGLNLSYTAGTPKTPDTPEAQAQNSLNQWAQKPAVYMPRVLAIVDEKVITDQPGGGNLPICFQLISHGISDQVIPNTGGSFSVAADFSPATGLTYSITTSSLPLIVTSVTINSNGLITVTLNNPFFTSGNFSATVTARDACGNTISSNIFNISWT